MRIEIGEARLKALKYIQYLSLDVVLGALISSAFLADLFGVQMPVSVYVGLGIAIWLIYTLDHLLDARRISEEAVNPRHAFHQRHQKSITVAVIAVFVLGVFNLWYLPFETVRLGLVLVTLVGLYLFSVHLLKVKKIWHKEFSAALLYTIGILTGPLSLQSQFDLKMVMIAALFFLYAMINLLLFPLYEETSDREDAMISIVTIWGRENVENVLRILFLIVVLVLGFVLMSETNALNLKQILVFAFMWLGLLAIFLKSDFFSIQNRYRWVGDGVFLVPILALV